MMSMLALAIAVLFTAAPAAPPVEWAQVKTGLGFAGFGGDYPFDESIIELPRGKIRLLISSGECGVTREQLRAWVAQAGAQIAAWYGRFPVDEATVTIITGGRGEIGGGKAFAGRFVHLDVGTRATQRSLDGDWRIAHELLHLAFPELDADLLYMTEGLSTYLEPLVRAQSGQLSAQAVWADMVDGFPKGMPGHFDRGLDHSHSWGNTYWGGARFWLLVDLEIRRQTNGKRSLQDALRAVLAAGGTMAVEWSLEQLFDASKRGTGTDALREVHAKMGAQRDSFDLDALWKRLGVKVERGRVTFDDTAELAATREAITRYSGR